MLLEVGLRFRKARAGDLELMELESKVMSLLDIKLYKAL